jgi:amidophosphoribosyltransferase
MDLGEKCGIFGVFGFNTEAARLVHSGLWALQHRGQESSGIASTEGNSIRAYAAEGLVAHVYSEKHLQLLSGSAAIGHNRYSTSGGSAGHHQPIIDAAQTLALAHNGNLPSTAKLGKYQTGHLNDSELMHAAIVHHVVSGKSLESAIRSSYPMFTGAFSLLVLSKNKIAAVRDPFGIRPLSIGKLNGGWVFSSETCALDVVGAKFVRDVSPGEMVVADHSGLTAYQLAPGNQKLDVFEYVYFARPDSVLLGKSVNTVRYNFGLSLARECPIAADVVIPIPDSAIPAALGYSHHSGLPFNHGLIKNRYIHRTFIRPAQKLRERDVEMKLNPLPSVINGKSVVVIDDSIVRGTTSKKIVTMLRAVGAKKVHLLISSPPVVYPDFYGIDTPSQAELIAFNKSPQQIAKFVGADTVYFLSYQGMLDSIGLPEQVLSTSCFTGRYPIPIGSWAKSLRHPKTRLSPL